MPLTGGRGRYLERLGLVEYSEHVHAKNGRLVRSYRPTLLGLKLLLAIAREGGDNELVGLVAKEIGTQP
jgi:hypothetical protein